MGPEEPGRRPPADPAIRSDRERDQLAELAELSRHEGFAAAADAPPSPEPPSEEAADSQ
jgi:hypothetical protein